MSACGREHHTVRYLGESTDYTERLLSTVQQNEETGKVDEALNLLYSAWEQVEAAESPANKALTAGLLGRHFLYLRGKLVPAEHYLIIQRDVLESHKSTDVRQLVHCYLDLSVIYTKSLDLVLAESYAVMAFGLTVENLEPGDVLLCESHLALGKVQYHMLAYEKAIASYHRALECSASLVGTEELLNRIELGLIRCYINRRDEMDSVDAASIFHSYERRNLGNVVSMADYERMRGIDAYLKSNHRHSIEHMKSAADLYRRTKIPDPFDRVDAYLVLSAAYLSSGNYTESSLAIDTALTLKFGKGYTTSDLYTEIASVGLYAHKAEILADSGIAHQDIDVVLESFSAYRLLDSLIRHFIKYDTESLLHHQFYNNFYYYKLTEIFVFLFSHTADQKWLHTLHDLFASYKAQALLREYRMHRLYQSTAAKSHSFKRFFKNDHALEDVLFRMGSGDMDNETQEYLTLNRLLRERRDIVAQMSSQAPDVLVAISSLDHIPAQDFLDYTVKNNTAVVQYYIGNPYYNKDHIYALVAYNGHFTLKEIDGSQDIFPIIDALYDTHVAVASGDVLMDSAQYFQWSATLYQRLFSDIHAEIATVDHVVIIPDERLHRVAFEALVVNDSTATGWDFSMPNYLIEKLSISYAFAPQRIIDGKMVTKPVYTREILAMGFSDTKTLDRRNLVTVPELPGAIYELQSIERHKGRRSAIMLSGYRCTKRNFLKYASETRMIHLSTHGEYDPQHRLSSMVHMSKGDTVEGLFAHELRFRGIAPELLVLSACDSGAGRLSNEEGMFSIGRAFQASGTGQVISALWLLSNRASTVYFEHFYMTYFSSDNAREALRQTKLQMLNRGDRYAFPAFWSAMILHE